MNLTWMSALFFQHSHRVHINVIDCSRNPPMSVLKMVAAASLQHRLVIAIDEVGHMQRPVLNVHQQNPTSL